MGLCPCSQQDKVSFQGLSQLLFGSDALCLLSLWFSPRLASFFEKTRTASRAQMLASLIPVRSCILWAIWLTLINTGVCIYLLRYGFRFVCFHSRFFCFRKLILDILWSAHRPCFLSQNQCQVSVWVSNTKCLFFISTSVGEATPLCAPLSWNERISAGSCQWWDGCQVLVALSPAEETGKRTARESELKVFAIFALHFTAIVCHVCMKLICKTPDVLDAISKDEPWWDAIKTKSTFPGVEFWAVAMQAARDILPVCHCCVQPPFLQFHPIGQMTRHETDRSGDRKISMHSWTAHMLSSKEDAQKKQKPLLQSAQTITRSSFFH